jgi:hypothetical protein
MAELAKQDGYREKVAMALVTMSAVLKTYGKDYDKTALTGWVAGMRARSFPLELVELTAEWFCGNAEEMPCPKTFMERGWMLKRENEAEVRMDAAREQWRREDEAKILALREKYPEIDAKFVNALWAREVMPGVTLGQLAALPERNEVQE